MTKHIVEKAHGAKLAGKCQNKECTRRAFDNNPLCYKCFLKKRLKRKDPRFLTKVPKQKDI